MKTYSGSKTLEKNFFYVDLHMLTSNVFRDKYYFFKFLPKIGLCERYGVHVIYISFIL